MSDKPLREIDEHEERRWLPQKQSAAVEILEDFLYSDMRMAEVNLAKLPEPEPKPGTREKSTKQDSFASSFYAWKGKDSTEDILAQKGIDIILIRRGEKIALKKKSTEQKER